jgi:hypothetical protein
MKILKTAAVIVIIGGLAFAGFKGYKYIMLRKKAKDALT